MTRRSGAGRFGPAWALAAVPLCVQFQTFWQHSAAPTIWTLVGVGAMLAASRRSAVSLLCVAVVEVALLAMLRPFALWWVIPALSGASTLIAAAGLGVVAVRRSPNGEPLAPRPSIVLSVPLFAADVLLVFRTGLPAPAAVLGFGCVLVATAMVGPRVWAKVEAATAPATTVASRVGGAVTRGVDAVIGVAVRIISLPLVGLVFLVTVIVPWAIRTVFRLDPTWAPRRPSSRWVERVGGTVPRVDALWFPDTGPRRPVIRHRARGLLAALAVTALVLGTVQLVSGGSEPGPPTAALNPPTPGRVQRAAAELAAQPWYRTWDRAYGSTIRRSRISQYAGIEFADVSSKYLNERGGIRRSWAPPNTACPRLRVWIFGGSTLFGVGQRDDHTVASELARTAWAEGLALDISNYGVPSDVAWTEQRRLERALAAATKPPDLVVFYDGFNDIRAAEWSYMAGQDVKHQFLSPNDRDLLPLLTRFTREDRDGRVKLVADPVNFKIRKPDERAIIDSAAFQYGASNRLSADLLRSRGIAGVRLFQPMLATEAGFVPENDYGAATQRRLAELRKRLPQDVVDISDALDAPGEQFYVDEVHTNERANPIIAMRIWDALKSRAGGVLTPTTAAPCR